MTKQTSATKKLLKLLLVIVVLFGGLAILASAMGWLDGNSLSKEVTVAAAEQRTITQIVSASGRIQPEVEVIIRPDVSGEIIELAVKEGDVVREGELLLRIKPDIYQARIDELNAALLTQRARLEQARAAMLQSEVQFKKNEQLYNRDLISELEFLGSKNDFEAQKANVRASEFQIQSAQAQLRRAEEELQQTVIRSPKDGTISRLAVERGERVLGQAQTAGTEMMRIARLEQMELVVDVNENDIVNVSVADTAQIQVDAYPNRMFEGIVTEIANSADITGGSTADQVTNYKVKIRITSPHNLDASSSTPFQLVSDQESPTADGFVASFKPGMSGTVDILTNTVYNVVSVPIQAVTVRNFADLTPASETNDNAEADSHRTAQREDFRRVVFIHENGTVRMAEVETGISDNTHIQIMSGIESGLEVVTGSYRVLSRQLEDNDEVTITNQS
ncbi:MAG: efflux RND transporter periplasmic adaptor subunit [Balneolaceae bacterium]